MGLLRVALLAGATMYGVAAVVRYRRRMDLAGRVVLITGGSRGLGLAIAREFALEGARLALLARDEHELHHAQRLLSPAEVRTYACDVTDGRQVMDTLALIRAEMGEVSVLVNNAGTLIVGPERSLTDGDYELIQRTNYEAPLRLMRAVIPLMRDRREGRIVNIASIGGKIPIPHQSGYAASKHALVGLSESLRSELVPHGVYVTTVCPGFIDDGAPMHALFKGRQREEFAWFNAAAASRAAADPVVLARRIVRACRDGDASLIYPRSAYLQQAIHNLMPGVMTEVATLATAQFLPDDDAGEEGRRPAKGRDLAPHNGIEHRLVGSLEGVRS